MFIFCHVGFQYFRPRTTGNYGKAPSRRLPEYMALPPGMQSPNGRRKLNAPTRTQPGAVTDGQKNDEERSGDADTESDSDKEKMDTQIDDSCIFYADVADTSVPN